ncbi:MAG: hypothetical protein WCV41_00015 [Patescibacteria group bacterium]
MKMFCSFFKSFLKSKQSLDKNGLIEIPEMRGPSVGIFNFHNYFLCVSGEDGKIFVGFLTEENITALYTAGYLFDRKWVLKDNYVRERKANEPCIFLSGGREIRIMPIGRCCSKGRADLLPAETKTDWLRLYINFFRPGEKEEFSKIENIIFSLLLLIIFGAKNGKSLDPELKESA